MLASAPFVALASALGALATVLALLGSIAARKLAMTSAAVASAMALPREAPQVPVSTGPLEVSSALTGGVTREVAEGIHAEGFHICQHFPFW